MNTVNFKSTADKILADLQGKGRKLMKVKTLLALFNYEKRTEEITSIITELLSERNIVINPSIMKLGDKWELKWNDKIYLSLNNLYETNSQIDAEIPLPSDWNSDNWFENILTKEYRNEKEVETKFFIPLLHRLGYSEDDRYDNMPLETHTGSKKIKLIADSALFNTGSDLLHNQVLLIAEAKKEGQLSKNKDLKDAQGQLKSYAIWSSCDRGILTDSKKIQVIDFCSPQTDSKVIFECDRNELKDKFHTLYNLISKSKLTKLYELKLS